MNQTISIGKQDFVSLRENHYFYIDKTDFIRQWWENADDITLITRPRRFGKTLNMNMLNCFFSRQYENRGDLFKGLSIWTDQRYQKLQGSYPVIFISFADVKQNNYKDAIQKIKNIIVDAYRQHRYLNKEDCFTENEKQQMMEITEKMDDVTAQDALKNLSSYLKLLYGKKVLIFLDEYDTPMQEAYINGYWDEFTGFMRGLFNATFKTNPYLERAIMTGITRASKESVFSDLNNLTVITTTSDQYADCFGFTEEEVAKLCEEYGMDFEEARAWYNGYHLLTHNKNKIYAMYSPKSVVEAMMRHKFGTYWNQTETYEALKMYIQMNMDGLKDAIIKMLAGEKVAINTGTFSNDMTTFSSKDDILTLLVHLGYLNYDSENEMVCIPNKEVSKEYMNAISTMDWHEVTDAVQESKELLEALWNLDEEKVAKGIDEEHGIIDIEYITEKCGNVFQKYDVNFCYLFGSYAKSKVKPTSDVDLLISANVKGLKFYGLVEEIREALHKKVDVLEINQLKYNLCVGQL